MSNLALIESQNLRAALVLSIGLLAKDKREGKEISFASACDLYYLHHAKLHKLSHKDDLYRNGIMKAFFGDIQLSQIGQESVSGFINHVIEVRKASPTTANRYRTQILVMWRILKTLGYNVQDIRLEKFKEHDKTQYFKESEIQSLLSSPILDEPRYSHLRTYINLGYYCGMRMGEILKLQWSRVNFDTNTITIFTDTTKTHKTRFVPMGPSLKSFLQELKSTSAGEYVIEYNGHPVRNIRRSYQKLLVSTGLNRPGYTKHTLRHSCGTNLLEKGADLRSIQTLMGHSSPNITAKYVHVADPHLRDQVSKLETSPQSSATTSAKPETSEGHR